MHYEVTEFMSCVKPRPCSVALVCAKNHHGMFGEWQRERINFGGVQRKTDDDDSVLLQQLDDVLDRTGGHPPLRADLTGDVLDLHAGRVQANRVRRDRRTRQHRCRRTSGDVIGHVGEGTGKRWVV
jgi:hypothetical protein